MAIVSPSAPAVAWWPHRVERGLAYLRSLGLETKIMPNAASENGWVSAAPEARAADLHDAFADDDVAVVLASIGGNHSNQVLPHLDFDLIAAHPKIFQGFSDMTVLQWSFLARAGLSSFYGTALTLGIAEYPEVIPYTDRYLRAAWFGDAPLRFEAAPEWTEEFLDFDTRADLKRARRMEPSEGWVTVREGVSEGPLIGGCLETICWHLKGSAYWPDLDGAVFFFETSEEVPSPGHVDAYLTDLEQMGVFRRAAGLLVGRPRGYSAADRSTLWRIVRERTEAAGIPVVGNIDCGHTDPMLTLPVGAPVRLDAGARVFETLAAPTTDRLPRAR